MSSLLFFAGVLSTILCLRLTIKYYFFRSDFNRHGVMPASTALTYCTTSIKPDQR
jgi:hypothetical protein